MRLLLVSDLHYALKQYDWVTAVASDFDFVVIAGDHLDISGHVDGSVQTVVILKYLKRLKAYTNVIVSSGNHDLDSRNAEGEKIAGWMNKVREIGIPTDGDSVVIGDVLITICPWWDGPKTKLAVQAQIQRDAATPKKRWIWVYHAPPELSSTSWNGRRFYGDAALSDWIKGYNPDIVCAGHIHEAPFFEGGSWADRIGRTWVFNCGRQLGSTPTHVIIDTDSGEAKWQAFDSMQTVMLDLPPNSPLIIPAT